MVQRQQDQGNGVNINVFENDKTEGKSLGGFTWSESPEGDPFWSNVIRYRNFDAFFEKYPKGEQINKLPEEYIVGSSMFGGFAVLDPKTSIIGRGETREEAIQDALDYLNKREISTDVAMMSKTYRDNISLVYDKISKETAKGRIGDDLRSWEKYGNEKIEISTVEVMATASPGPLYANYTEGSENDFKEFLDYVKYTKDNYTNVFSNINYSNLKDLDLKKRISEEYNIEIEESENEEEENVDLLADGEFDENMQAIDDYDKMIGKTASEKVVAMGEFQKQYGLKKLKELRDITTNFDTYTKNLQKSKYITEKIC
jgi:hypothetical protein